MMDSIIVNELIIIDIRYTWQKHNTEMEIQILFLVDGSNVIQY